MLNRTVLLVEDFENDVVLMWRSWKMEAVPAGLQVVTDGQQALDYLAGNGEFSNREKFPLPCLMLLDLKLPHVSGMEVLKRVRTETALKALPVLVLTTSGLERDVIEAYQCGANAFLIKPSSVRDLAMLVRLIRDFWLGVNQLPRLDVETELSLGP